MDFRRADDLGAGAPDLEGSYSLGMKVRIPDTLNLPAQHRVEDELLKLLASRSRPLSTTEAYRTLADTFGLTAAQRVARRKEGSADPAWSWLVRRAMQRLQVQKWTYRPDHGSWSATEAGRNQAEGIREDILGFGEA